MTRLYLPLVLLLLACSEGAKDPAAEETDTGVEETVDTDDSDDTDAGEDSGAEDTGGGDTGAGDTGAGDTGAGDTGAGDTGAGDTGAQDTGAGGDTGEGPDGAALFGTYCASCHGPDGGGTGSGPDITGEVDRSDENLLDIIQNGKSDMPGQDVTDAEAQAIVDWMRASF